MISFDIAKTLITAAGVLLIVTVGIMLVTTALQIKKDSE